MSLSTRAVYKPDTDWLKPDDQRVWLEAQNMPFSQPRAAPVRPRLPALDQQRHPANPPEHQRFPAPTAAAQSGDELIALAGEYPCIALRGYRAQGKPWFFLQYRVNSKRSKTVFQGATPCKPRFRWYGMMHRLGQNVCVALPGGGFQVNHTPSISGDGARPE